MAFFTVEIFFKVDEFSFYSNEAEKELLEEEIHSQEEEPIDQNSHGASVIFFELSLSFKFPQNPESIF